ncbi:MAG: hypothetical protein ABSD03_10665 [Vulcanimicrobiaceae bacterium]
MFAVLVARLAVAVVLDVVAFVVWDVGTRAPLDLITDVRRAVAARRGLLAGSARFAVGAVLLLLAGLIAGPAMPDQRTFTLLETGMLIAALLVEQLIGPDLRGRRNR